MTGPDVTGPEPMYPSLAAQQTREGITEYLATTFALSDPAVDDALRDFLQHADRGIFRGPYARVRLPFLPVGESWVNPLGWLPPGFRPYRHQAEAFARLSTVPGPAEPTIVTTGTGSGKTEAFLLPLLDHARRARARGETGIKAIILYPMNALVTDQARRIAGLLHDNPELAQVTAGVYIGGDSHQKVMTPDALIDDRQVLRDNPPDLLLTNYRMLDLLLLRRADAPLWQASAASLQFLVLDEFHTYDGAQGTDVAMLLRRLGATLGVATPDRPLGRVCPIATSATLGAGSRGEELRRFARTVFGREFGPEAVIGEHRVDPRERFRDLDYDLDIPDVDDVLAAPLPDASRPLSWQPLAEVFLGSAPADEVELGERLSQHILTRATVLALHGDPRTIPDAVREAADAGALRWGSAARTDPDKVAAAMLRFLALVSAARLRHGDRLVPLVQVEIQLWIREVSRVLRELSDQPRFAWWSDGPPGGEASWAPAVYCRHCGSSGWQVLGTELGEEVDVTPRQVWQHAISKPGRLRTLIPAAADDEAATGLDPGALRLHRGGELRVLVTPDDDAAARERCPACGTDDGIRFIGTAVATLVSVSLTQLFGLTVIPEAEKKTLVFTDSVQDAAHRAAFVEARAFRFNFRSALLRAVGPGPATLTDVADRLADSPDEDLYLIAPPDFARRLGLTGTYLDPDPKRRTHARLADRLAAQTQLEVGLDSRMGRTLELTGALGVHLDWDVAAAAATAAEVHQNSPAPQLPGGTGPDAYRHWLLGLADRLRSRGGIIAPWLAQYLSDDGRRWSIWGGARPGMPKFPRGRPAPVFLTTATRSDAFDSLSAPAGSWLADWTARCLGVSGAGVRELLRGTMAALAADPASPVLSRTTGSGATVYGLDPDRIMLSPAPDELADQVQLRCDSCDLAQPTSAARQPDWVGSPCPRFRCGGHLAPARIDTGNFYRRLYRQGRLRRIIAAEHTGLLDRAEREAVETQFKTSATPVSPNVLACTPTLELGIDIGDLSSVTLSSLPRTPASYLQRVGRAGRASGNSLVLATAPTGPRDLYYFAEPLNLIAGEVVPPSTYLAATELLQRQYLAYCLDRHAAGGPGGPTGALPGRLGELFHNLLQDGTWLRGFTDHLSVAWEPLVDGFLALFGRDLPDSVAEAVREYAHSGVKDAIAATGHNWQDRRTACQQRVQQLNAAITELDKRGHLDDEQQQELRAMRSERIAQLEIINQMGNQETLTGLSELSLLPNYNLIDDATTLDVSLWWRSDDEEGVQVSEHSYRRGSRLALRDFAPGATFYARGQQVIVDAVEVGSAGNPLWTRLRLCPECGWGGSAGEPVAQCPRCGTAAIADTGAVHQVLPLREVSAQQSRESSVIEDHNDHRAIRRYELVTGVDIDPGHIQSAWRLRDQVFGAEYATRATVRTLNFGAATAAGTTIRVAGEPVRRSTFLTCSHCGVVRPHDKEESEVRHRGWCGTRKGADPRWQPLVLSHELVTQAVRIALPVSMFNHESQLVAVKGALLLGLRADFGGDPQHLDVISSSMPDTTGKPRRFLVLHDTVPGGTGYLDRLGDPDRLCAILTLARDQLAACPCRLEDRPACHRCLLSVLSGSELERADREESLELVNGFLADWHVEQIATVTDIDYGKVHLSELEQRFQQAVRAHISAQDRSSVTATMGPKGTELDLTLSGADRAAARWLMKPLVGVSAGGLMTEPDFLLHRQDDQDAPVAVYLDGKEFHASVAHNRTADDAQKRAELRSAGYRVWSITWDDVAEFEQLVAGKEAKPGPESQFALKTVRNRALELMSSPQFGSAPGARDRLDQLLGNPVAALLAYLAEPADPAWASAAEAVLVAWFLVSAQGGRDPARPLLRVTGERPHDQLWRAAHGSDLGPADPDAGWCLAPVVRPGLGVALFAAGRDPRPSLGILAVLDDTDAVVGSPDHEAAWRVWLRWSNLAQFLPLPRYGQPAVNRVAEFWTTRSRAGFDAAVLSVGLAGAGVPGAAGGAGPEGAAGAARTDGGAAGSGSAAGAGAGPGGLPESWAAGAELVDDELGELYLVLAGIVEQAPEVGYEIQPEGWPVELAWPSARLAVLVDEDAERDRWLTGHGWTLLRFTPDAEPGSVVERVLRLLAGQVGREQDVGPSA